MNEKPKCMTDAEMEQWSFWNARLLDASHKADTACVDCTAEFKAEMLAEGRCADQRPPDVDLPPERPVHTSESWKRFRRLERRALVMVREGKSQVEAAKRLGVAQTTVSKWVVKARERAAK